MIRNKIIKKLLINTVFQFFSFINQILPKNEKTILIYCANDSLNDNSEVLYNYLIENQYYENYKIYCSLKKYKNYTSPNRERIKFISQTSGIVKYLFSKYMFYSMGKIPIKPSKKQMIINLWHGIPLKGIGKLSSINNGEEFFFTYVCASSEMYRPIMAKAFGCPEKNVCICGEQKTDKLYYKKNNISSHKLVVWAPTFRQSAYLGYNDSNMTSFLPFIDNTEWDKLNEFAKDKNIKLIVKLHALQDLSGFLKKTYSNLEVYSNGAFTDRGYDLYELMAQSDALLTDYSSVYLEYLLLNRPIGFTLNDIDEYKNARGFVFENPLDFMPGEKIYSKKNLFDFLDNISNGVDGYSEERKRVCDLVHKYKDGKNCARVLEIAGITK